MSKLPQGKGQEAPSSNTGCLWGAWLPQSAEHVTLDLVVGEVEPHVGREDYFIKISK